LKKGGAGGRNQGFVFGKTGKIHLKTYTQTGPPKWSDDYNPEAKLSMTGRLKRKEGVKGGCLCVGTWGKIINKIRR